MKKIIISVTGLLLAGSLSASAMSTIVKDVVEFNELAGKMQPGDTLILASGVWKDADLVVNSSGKPGKPVCIIAKKPGKVKLTGGSRIVINGKHVLVSGLWFYGPSTRKEFGVVIFGKKSSFCRVTEPKSVFLPMLSISL